MRYRAETVKYWQQGDNKCQMRPGRIPGMIIICLVLDTYAIIGLAQKLQCICSPIKTLTGDRK